MIYIPERFLFIHIPRTSGINLCRSVLLCSPEPDPHVNIVMASYCSSSVWWRHSQASLLKPTLSEWDSEHFQKVTIIRNPWEIVESSWRYLVRRGLQPSLSFSEWVLQHFSYLRHGFYDHWCCDWITGDDLGVDVLRFETLYQSWSTIGRMLEIPISPKVAHNSGGDMDLHWTPQAVEFIGSRCQGDFARFGYPDRPPQTAGASS